MKPDNIKVALVQMRVAGGEKRANLERASNRIAEAAAEGAKIVLLPECMDLGWTHPSSLEEAEAIPEGAPFQALASAAKENQVFLCAGLTEKEGDAIYNTAVLIDPRGNLLLKHRKLNELEIGHPYYAQGDRLNVVKTEYGTIGLMICADGFAKDLVLARSLGYMGADLILSPCAWAVDADHDNERTPYGSLWRDSYIPVAKEFSMPIVAASNVGPIEAGPWTGRRCIGCSLVIDAKGNEVLQGPYGVDADCLLFAELPLIPRPARADAWINHWSRDHRL